MYNIKQWFHFGYNQALSCIFPVCIFLTLAISKSIDIPFLYRYDFILIICLAIQILMYVTGLETKDEMKVIAVFHVIGLMLEIYKVHMGSWSYPEPGLLKVFGVPLYSGFMYASVASYLCQAWRRLDVELLHWPRFFWTVSFGTAIYFNFFTHHYIYDLRWVLVGILFVLFFKTYVSFTVNQIVYRMPLILSFFLIGLFIWIAENIATFFGAWQYPDQRHSWSIVHLGKISSWFLLVIVSFIIVAQLKHVKTALNNSTSGINKAE